MVAVEASLKHSHRVSGVGRPLSLQDPARGPNLGKHPIKETPGSDPRKFWPLVLFSPITLIASSATGYIENFLARECRGTQSFFDIFFFQRPSDARSPGNEPAYISAIGADQPFSFVTEHFFSDPNHMFHGKPAPASGAANLKNQ